MCGIAGFISKKYASKDLVTMAGSLSHRGPDAEGIYTDTSTGTGLAHRRLSILDLNETANQPMFSADGRYCIVYNGEVYNFLELKQELNCKGASLKTNCDTEVILELFAQKGISSLSLLNGMFAFAVYDTHLKTLTLCRDQVGIKPLFYFQDEETFIFASELKAIKALLKDKLTVNKEVIPHFLHVGFIPEPYTIYKQIYKFPSASYVVIDTASQNIGPIQNKLTKFWKIEDKILQQPIINEAVAKQELKKLVLDSVQHQLISDVPVGTFLSGGVDSSLVSAAAVKIAGAKNVNTFSLAIDNGSFNESKYSNNVASHLQTNHFELKVSHKEVVELIDTLIPTYDEPFADTSAFPTLMVSKLAKKHITVALSGDGGDELFLGYGMYKWANRLNKPLIPFVKNPIYQASKKMNSKYQRIGTMFNFKEKIPLPAHIFSQEQYFFSTIELQHYLLKDQATPLADLNFAPAFNRSMKPAEMQAYWDFNNYLKDDLLVKVDRASMHYSLETRVPLLDINLVEFAFNLDPGLKMKNGSMKYLLKEVLGDFIPKELINQSKWGFSIPINKWLQTDLKYIVDKYTTKEVIEKHSILDAEKVQLLVAQYNSGVNYLYNRVWVVAVLHWWLETN